MNPPCFCSLFNSLSDVDEEICWKYQNSVWCWSVKTSIAALFKRRLASFWHYLSMTQHVCKHVLVILGAIPCNVHKKAGWSWRNESLHLNTNIWCSTSGLFHFENLNTLRGQWLKKLTFKNDQMGSSFTECGFTGSICQPHSFNPLGASLQSPRDRWDTKKTALHQNPLSCFQLSGRYQ